MLYRELDHPDVDYTQHIVEQAHVWVYDGGEVQHLTAQKCDAKREPAGPEED